MSPSSSGSWSGTRGADIIDLDRYMRGSVRPSRTQSDDSRHCDRLVVDGGGISRKPCDSASGDARYKRYSHDSGVSDGSYKKMQRRVHRPHRRTSGTDGTNFRSPREPTSARTLGGRANSSSSLRAFRAVCEQALLDQQKQITRVAQLCELLTERAEKAERSEKSVPNGRIERAERSERNIKCKKTPSMETSEISSSSRSTKDLKMKDKHRTQECKTYKIIMNKLDELNRLFATRPRSPPPQPARAPLTTSSTSVSMCDKVIATDPQRTFNRVVTPTVQTIHSRDTSLPKFGTINSTLGSHTRRSSRLATVTQAFTVDIAPRGAPVKTEHPNVVTESIIKCDSSCNASRCSAGDPRCGFDLEDPMHLYSQAKRLQGYTVTATGRCARSAEGPRVAPELDARSQAQSHDRSDSRAPSLCAVCRAYFRYLRQCLVGPVFGKSVGDCKCS